MEKSDLKYYILTKKNCTKKPLWISEENASSLYYLHWDSTEEGWIKTPLWWAACKYKKRQFFHKELKLYIWKYVFETSQGTDNAKIKV